MEESIDSQIAAALDEFENWGTIEEIFAFVTERVAIPKEFRDTAVRKALTPIIRRKIKARHDDEGLAEFESVERTKEDGNTERVYKQITLFDKNDYQLAVSYYQERGLYYCKKANSLVKRCNTVLGTKRQMPFPQFGLLSKAEDQPSHQ